MNKYKINGKQYTEDDINLAIAEINILSLDMSESMDRVVASHMRRNPPNYCQNPIDTDAIIDKCLDELFAIYHELYYHTNWERIMKTHNCTKLTAACICLIELNE